MLNRPFHSVGEMGYVFRDMPWKTLDLFSANSADSGLLDLFTLSDAPVIAGRVNPNSPYAPVLGQRSLQEEPKVLPVVERRYRLLKH